MVSVKGPSSRSYLRVSSENFVIGRSSKRSITKESMKEETINLLLNVGWKIGLKHRNGKDCEKPAYLTLIEKTIWSITLSYDTLKMH